jgi:hypothetical protein
MDNMSAITLSKNLKLHDKSKHIKTLTISLESVWITGKLS